MRMQATALKPFLLSATQLKTCKKWGLRGSSRFTTIDQAKIRHIFPKAFVAIFAVDKVFRRLIKT